MAGGFTKLHSNILTSTIWREDPVTKVVWVTLLAMADQDGLVETTVPGLAGFANVTIEDTEAAIKKFTSPDKHSRTKDQEGRRVELIDGGLRLLNYDKYREKLSKEDLKEKARIRQHNRREREKAKRNGDCHAQNVTERDTSVTVTECYACHDKQRQRQKEKEKEKEKH